MLGWVKLEIKGKRGREGKGRGLGSRKEREGRFRDRARNAFLKVPFSILGKKIWVFLLSYSSFSYSL